MLLCTALLTGLFLLVDLPPLVDVPGHIGSAAIEAARPGNALRDYFQWNWALIPNLGGQVLMKLLAYPFGVLAAGWWTSLIATVCLALGAMATIRVLNPRGAFAMGWAMIFVFGFPWVWGFVNYILATGIGLLLFAASVGLRARLPMRAVLLLAGQPLVFMCHAIGGLILPILVAAESLGAALDDMKLQPELGRKAILRRRLLRECWPLAATPLLIAAWKALASIPAGSGMAWDVLAKLDFLMEVLRDQSLVLDMASAVACYMIVMFGYLLGARWTWRQGLPALAVFATYCLLPARIGGSEAVDVRLLPVAMVLALGLQDWSKASARTIRLVALSGAAILSVRLGAIAVSFLSYDANFRGQLEALDHVAPGSRVIVYRRQSCSNVQWRMSRIDTLPALASLKKQVWINSHWMIPGLDMLQSRFTPAPEGSAALSPMVWDLRCPDSDGRSLDEIVGQAPLSRVDYLWLIDTGTPRSLPPMLDKQWQWQDSALYRVRH
jgi:hypothetical protein